MNKLDKSWYTALKFLANHTRAEIAHWKEEGDKDYEESVPSTEENPIEQTLVQFGYLNLNGKTKWMITQSGLQQLRDLEAIRNKDLILIVAVGSLIISVLSFSISIGWIKIG